MSTITIHGPEFAHDFIGAPVNWLGVRRLAYMGGGSWVMPTSNPCFVAPSEVARILREMQAVVPLGALGDYDVLCLDMNVMVSDDPAMGRAEAQATLGYIALSGDVEWGLDDLVAHEITHRLAAACIARGEEYEFFAIIGEERGNDDAFEWSLAPAEILAEVLSHALWGQPIRIDMAKRLALTPDEVARVRAWALAQFSGYGNAEIIVEGEENNAMTPEKFFETFAPACQAAMRKNGGFASVRLAQIALESNWGEAEPRDIDDGRRSFNVTGVKGVGSAGSVRCWTWEVEDGEDIRVLADFAAYNSYEEHVMERDRVFLDWPENYGEYLAAKTPEEAIRALAHAPMPYATDERYEEKLLAILTTYDLKRFDALFIDVPSDAWYGDDLRFLVDAGIVNGDGNGEYRPDEPLTRAEAARLLRLVIRYIVGK